MNGFQFDRVRQVCEAPDGVDRLRQLILDLAVEGRLLPGSAKGSRQRRVLTLPEVADYRIGKTPPSKESRHWDAGGIPWVSISDMVHFGTLTATSRGLSRACVAETFKYPPVPAGSLLMSFKLTVGKVCILGVDGYHNEAIISIQPKEGVSRDYLMRVLPSIAKQGKSKDALMGATLNSSTLAQLAVPLPDLDEQLAIVAKVDELMALCDRLEARQQDAEAAHARLVQALLDSLTQARDAEEFQACWERVAGQFESLFTTDSSIEALEVVVLQLAVTGRLTAETTRPAVPADDTSELPPLAAGWVYRPFNELVDPERPVAYGVLVPGPEVDGGVPFVRIGDLSLQSPADLPEKTIGHDVDAKFSRTRLVGGEILMGVVGSVGKLGIAPASWAGANIARAICRIVPAHSVNKDFVLLLLRSDLMRRQFLGDTRTLAQPTLNVGLIRAAKAPVPPLAEQAQVVRTAHELLALCDQLKARIAAARAKQAQLAEALVAQAVAG
ncbi:MAG TPA: restriction endonuclease subunit S [Burkholderiaceae bacterium]|nr:restriction endonuclease subunit S [Burkholderiaceae bacterium]HMX09343.1 restriction endonuclease subunit S [Burkholderiaceae bacterium]HMY98301.1 restriction endonuclease subunit S [Burkholderiaceae bacterium]HNB44433.1 restriction endonuclease subunit S [Burkholderiaceae bacterium]HNG78906.1 restriction endonuclease subunit S [Burkholderiaceae bacterium]